MVTILYFLLCILVTVLDTCTAHGDVLHECMHDTLPTVDFSTRQSYVEYDSHPKERRRQLIARGADDAEIEALDRMYAEEHAKVSEAAKSGHGRELLVRFNGGGTGSETYGARTAYNNIRFHVDTSYINNDPQQCTTVNQVVVSQNVQFTCTQADIPSTAVVSTLTNTILPQALTYLSDHLNVVPVVGNLKVTEFCTQTTNGVCTQYSPTCIDTINIPPTYVNTGVAGADFIVLVTMRPTSGYVTDNIQDYPYLTHLHLLMYCCIYT